MNPHAVTQNLVQGFLLPRKKDAHKGNFGHVLILAGSRNLSGAAALCGWGALRGGAGLVTVATPKSVQIPLLKWLRPEAMTFPLPESRKGCFSPKAIPLILDFIIKRKITTLAIGPGLSANSKPFVKKLILELQSFPYPIQGIVLDADGFLALSPEKNSSTLFKNNTLPILVTPHSGEMAKFLGSTSGKVEKERIKTAQKFARLYGVTTVLKGYRTVITDGHKTYINSTGTPGMARGGAGDILTGLIAALIAQVKEKNLLKAAILGVYLHGLAGEIAQKKKSQVALLAGEIASALPTAFKKIL